jgi:flavin-dependent dehydrogenase
MTVADNLKKSNNNISQLEENLLYKNPHLKKIFLNSEKFESFPVTISQINFNKKTQIENGILMLGDSAGMITPLCGNGMSIALHSAKIAATIIKNFLEQKISRPEMEEGYTKEWTHLFANRLKNRKNIAKLFRKRSPQQCIC